MPLTIVRQDITKMEVDAIVNAANTGLARGGGVCGAIFSAAGAKKMEAACAKLSPIRTGEAAITPGFALSAKYVIHAAGPVYHRQDAAESGRLLGLAYTNSLRLAVENHCGSIAFPLISSGIYGYPKADALRVAVSAIKDFLVHNELDVYLVIFDKASFDAGKELVGAVENYLSEHFVAEVCRQAESRILPEETGGYHAGTEEVLTPGFRQRAGRGGYTAVPAEASQVHTLPEETEGYAAGSLPVSQNCPLPEETRKVSGISKSRCMAKEKHPGGLFEARKIRKENEQKEEQNTVPVCSAADAGRYDCGSVDERIALLDEPFSTTLLRMIDAKGRTDVEVYKKANIDRKLFSKIRTNPDYMPSKRTALAFAVALELDVEETRELLLRAGFALSHSRKLDVIVEYFLMNKKYDIFEINEVLFAYDQPLLGG